MSCSTIMKRVAGVALGGTLSFALQAATTSGPYEVKAVLVGGQGAHVEVAPNPQPCAADWAGTQFVIRGGHVFFQEMLSAVLTAQTANQRVTIWWDPEGTGDCSYTNQLVIDAIQLRK